jgi:DNA invertase Pin-like site-specific DNA recombinase
MSIKIVKAARSPEYDLNGIHIDLARKTGVLIRQSRKGADLDSRESRLRQESLVPVAIALRGDADGTNIILYDEGSGVSGTKGYDQRPELSRLYMDIANDVIGCIVVARADRLFRDKHFRNVSMFTELAERKRITVIVPGRAIYDFTKTRDLQAFQREMQEAYNYIATQVAYMQDTRRQKVERGFYGGANLPAPYAIDKTVAKEYQIPVIYEPWRQLVVDLFTRFRDLDFVLSRIARHIEEQPYLFPYPSAQDLQRYQFKTRMRTRPGGYTFSGADSIKQYFSNLTLGGYAKIGRDTDGNQLLLANAFEEALPFDLLSQSYAAITGHYPDGTPFKRQRIVARSARTLRDDSSALLHGLLTSADGSVSYLANRSKQCPYYVCNKGLSKEGWLLKNKVGIMHQEKAWAISCEDLDYIVLRRLNELTHYDRDLVRRLQDSWNQRHSSSVDEIALLEEQLDKSDAQIRRLDKLLTDPAVPLTPDAERRYLELLRDAEHDRQRLTQKLAQQETQADPVQVIPTFYAILADFSKEFARLAPRDQKRLMRHVVQDIKLNILTPHLFQLHVVWQNGMATCPDIALLWRGMAPKTEHAWSEEEDAIMRTLYASAEQEDLMRRLPDRTWSRIYERAQDLQLRRTLPHNGPHPFNTYHRTLTYNDLEAVAGLVSAEIQQDRMRQVVNDLARRTMRGGLTAHWWLLLEQISYAGSVTPE